MRFSFFSQPRCNLCAIVVPPEAVSLPSDSRRLRAWAKTKSSGLTPLCRRLTSMVYDFGRRHGYNYHRDAASPRLGAGAFANGGRGGDSCRWSIDTTRHDGKPYWGCLASTGVNIPLIAKRTTVRPLYGLKAFSTTIATDINDLPVTSPHGSDFGDHAQILGHARDPNTTRGTAMTHRDKCCDPIPPD
jgi:hypothetical protein